MESSVGRHLPVAFPCAPRPANRNFFKRNRPDNAGWSTSYATRVRLLLAEILKDAGAFFAWLPAAFSTLLVPSVPHLALLNHSQMGSSVAHPRRWLSNNVTHLISIWCFIFHVFFLLFFHLFIYRLFQFWIRRVLWWADEFVGG